METVSFIALASLIGKFVDLLKFLRVRDMNSAITQLVTWAVGVAAAFLASAANVASGLKFSGVDLVRLNGASKVLLGLMLPSLMSTVYDFKKAVDGTDSAKTPPLVTSAPPGA